MKARLVIRERTVFEDGHLMEIVIWLVPAPVPPAEHDFKYRLFYGRRGARLLGYDNERGKGDHRHIAGMEEPYAFTTIKQLLDDFERDVAKIRKETI